MCGEKHGGEPATTVSPIRPEMPDVYPPANRDENSRAAADSMEAPAQRLRRQVYDLIQRWEPVATWELEELLNMSHQTVSARVWELHEAGLVVRVGKNVAPSGRKAWQYAIQRGTP